MSQSLRRFAILACLVTASIIPLLSASSADAATPAAVVPSILKSSDTYLGNIREFFLCSTAKCKKDRASILKAAESSMSSLLSQSSRASHARLQNKYRPVIALFVRDVRLLDASYKEYFITTSTVTLSGLTGNIFYLTSDVGADINVLRAREKGATVNFSLWVEGEAATLVAMQTDASALQSSKATVSIGIYANQLLEAGAHEMLAQATGPNAAFNTLLKEFAHNQLRISQSEVLFLHNKKAPMTETQVANLNVTVAAEFSKLIKDESALVKKK
ncbi:MAG TPA: hypothetical protein VIJ86_12850 [Acidimicrobiales bacterium]